MAAVGGQSPSLEKRKKTSHGGREEKKRKDYPRIHVALLRPTQFNVGYSQVEKLVTRTNAQLAQCKSGKERKRLLRELNRKKKAPIVVGPGDQLYLIDHHHWCRALWESEVKFSRKKVYYYIISDLSHLSPDDFWAEMKRNKWVYLNSRGEPRNPEQLPEDVTGLEDDPFRSLARVVRGKRKGWKKARLPFTEFLWADYLRTHSGSFVALAKEIRFDSKENRAAFELAVQLCRAGEAASLPGYLGKPPGEPEAMIVSV